MKTEKAWCVLYNRPSHLFLVKEKMIDFLDLYEKQKRKEQDKIYFSQAFDNKGRRYSQEFDTQLDTLANGGFGFLRLTKLKSIHCENTFTTKVISKENVSPWQLRGKTLIEADILSSVSHDNIVKVSIIISL